MAYNSFQSFVRKNTALATATTILALAGLGSAAVFSLKDSSSNSVFECYTSTGCIVYGNLSVDGAQISTGSSLSLTSGDARYVRKSGSTMTGQLVINLTSGFYGLKLLNTMSGNIIHAEKNLSSSGSITVRGTMSGNLLFGKRCPSEMAIQYAASGTTLAVNSGTTLMIPVPMSLTGYTISKFVATTDSAGVTGLTRFAIRNVTKGKRAIFTTNPSIDTAETSTVTAATAYSINASNADVAGNDKLSFDILQIQTGTAPKGLSLLLTFSCPAS